VDHLASLSNQRAILGVGAREAIDQSSARLDVHTRMVVGSR
jgi:hypothetical protein